MSIWMIVYEIFVTVVTFATISKCSNPYGILVGLFIYSFIGIIPLILAIKKKELTREEKIRLYKKRLEDEEYFNNFGELP